MKHCYSISCPRLRRKIKSGEKTTTIRPEGKRMPKVGDIAVFLTERRVKGKPVKRIGEYEIKGVAAVYFIEGKPDGRIEMWGCPMDNYEPDRKKALAKLAKFRKGMKPYCRADFVSFDDWGGERKFAEREGFADYQEMIGFFRAKYPPRRLLNTTFFIIQWEKP